MALNGQFPRAMLAHLGWPEADHLQLVPGAAASITRLAAKFEAAFGKPLYITDAYRTLASQKALKVSKGKFAATPGTSNHGLGLAIDMASRINVDGSAEHLWMSVHGPAFGWINPWWATDWNPTNGQHEPWHWEWDYRLDQSAFAQAAPTALTPEAPDMDTAQNDALAAAWKNTERMLQILEAFDPQRAALVAGATAAVDANAHVRQTIGVRSPVADQIDVGMVLAVKAAGGQAIDYALLAKAVADEQSRRLAS